MIIKIKDFRENSWWIFDGVNKVRYENGLVNELSLEERHKWLTDTYDIAILKDPLSTEATNKFALLILKYSNDNIESIVFDTVAYICNDAGNTTERIIP